MEHLAIMNYASEYITYTAKAFSTGQAASSLVRFPPKLCLFIGQTGTGQWTVRTGILLVD